MPTLHAPALEEFSQTLLIAAGALPDEARIVAHSLVGSNLCGHDSHGVMRIPFYVDFIRAGRMHPGAILEVLSETPAVLACDAGWGFGQVQARCLIERLMPKAHAL